MDQAVETPKPETKLSRRERNEKKFAESRAGKRLARRTERSFEFALRGVAAWSTTLQKLGLPEVKRGRGSCGGETKLAPGAQYLPHTGIRQKMRAHNQAWRQWEKLVAKDEWARATDERLKEYLTEAYPKEPVEITEMRAKSLALAARQMAEHKKRTWTEVLNQALNELEESLPKYESAV